jgi:hypothetical protein
MSMNSLPRPWVLAALAKLPITELAREDVREPNYEQRRPVLPRADQRRARLATWRGSGHVYAHDGMDSRRGAVDRPNLAS